MNRNQIEVVTIGEGVSHTGSYNVLLKEKYGTRKMVVVISHLEAQSIAMSLNQDLSNKRVMTHDLFYNVGKTFNIEMLEVNIESLREGIYYTSITFKKNDMIESFDSRLSDALALSLKYVCPIYINSSLFDRVAFGGNEGNDYNLSNEEDELDINLDSLTDDDYKGTDSRSSLKNKSIEELNELLNKAIQDENYELAAQIRDEIENRA